MRYLFFLLFLSCTLLVEAAEWQPADAYRFTDIEQLAPANGKKGKIAILQKQGDLEGDKWVYTVSVLQGKDLQRVVVSDNPITDIGWVNNQLVYLVEVDGVGSLHTVKKQLKTEIDGSIVRFHPSPSGKQIALEIKGDRGTILYLLGDKQPLSSEDQSMGIKLPNVSWSPDEKSIAFIDQPTDTATTTLNSCLSIVDLKSGKSRRIPTGGGAVLYPFFSPSGRQVAFVRADPRSQEVRNPAYHIFIYDLDTDAIAALAHTPDEGVEIVGWSPDGKSIIAYEFFKTAMRLYAVPTNGGPVEAISARAEPVTRPVLGSNGRLYYVGHNFDHHHEVYELDLGTQRLRQLTHIQPTADLPKVAVREMSWKAPDGKTIEGTLLLPSPTPTGAVPLVVLAHGGPGSNSNRHFIGTPYKGQFPIMPALFTSRGYAVLLVNFRGSDGYGLDFRWANYRDFGEGPYQDIVAGVEHLIKQGIADPTHVSLVGWSYGGYLGAFAATKNNPFTSIAAWGAPTNLISLFGTQDISCYLPTYFGGLPYQLPKLYQRHSPVHLFHSQVDTPMLLLHGGQDVRVPLGQSLEFYRLYESLELPTKLRIFDNEGHSIKSPKNQVAAEKEISAWIDKWNEREVPSGRGVVVDSSGIHQARAAKIVAVKTENDVAGALSEARKSGLKVVIFGDRHSQGEQVIAEGAIALDMKPYNKILHIDEKRHEVTVQAGATWDHLQKALQPKLLAPYIMQSLNNFTVGGSISSNIVGRDPRKAGIWESVVSMRLMLADGSVVDCSATENAELFSGAIGGFGLLGVILDVTLKVEVDAPLVQHSSRVKTSDYASYFRGLASEQDDVAYHAGYFSLTPEAPFGELFNVTYRTQENPSLELEAKDVEGSGYKIPPALSTIGYVTQESAQSIYFLPDGSLNFVGAAVPLDRFALFMAKVELLMKKTNIPVLQSTTKIIKKDSLTMLPLVTEDETVVLVVAYSQAYSSEALEESREMKQGMAKLAVEFGGRTYLTFNHEVTAEQLDAMYPRWEEFLALKRKVDPDALFSSNFYDRLVFLEKSR